MRVPTLMTGQPSTMNTRSRYPQSAAASDQSRTPNLLHRGSLAGFGVGFVSKPSCNRRPSSNSVFRMCSAFVDWHFCEVKRTHPFDASHIDSVLVWRRATLMEGVNTAL